MTLASSGSSTRWTRVEVWKKKAVPLQDGLSTLQTATDATMSNADITLSPVMERMMMMEDKLPSGPDECIDSVLPKTFLF